MTKYDIDNALNIKWADMESRVRGQNAFATGHQYCVNHLRSCSSMSSNMRDAYKSEISRDCAAYESSLQKNFLSLRFLPSLDISLRSRRESRIPA